MRFSLIGALLLVLGGLSVAQAASFDCTAAKADDEKAVCAKQELSDLDVRMATMYDMTLRLVARRSEENSNARHDTLFACIV